MASRGYTEKDHNEGWRLLHAVSGFVVDDGEPADPTDAVVREAIVALDAWDEDGSRLTRAALGRLHPNASAFVLIGLAPTTGVAAILSVKNLLDRFDALAKEPGGKAALETLAQRGITTAERARLRALVKVAESATPVRPETASDDAAAHLECLRALRVWYEDWSDTARVAVKRRDHLILLGLAKRKSPKTPAPVLPARA